MQYPRIAFIGGGNMAASLIGGLINDGWPTDRLSVADPDPAKRKQLAQKFSLRTEEDNVAGAEEAAILVLAVKPGLIKDIARGLSAALGRSDRLWLSIAAGVRVASLENWIGGGAAIVRAMPNTPALLQTGASALFANQAVGEAQREMAESILRAVGITVWVDREADLDAVTALSGSGPAYFFRIMELLLGIGEEMGLSAEQARILTLQTAFGAAKMALESTAGPAALRQQVTSPGGTTERALAELEAGELAQLLRRALEAARARARQIGDELGDT